MPSHKAIKSLFQSAVQSVASHVSDFVTRPGRDFTRNRKLPFGKLVQFLVTQGSSSTRLELLDFFGMDEEMPTSSALRQQMDKLKPEALQSVFNTFTDSYFSVSRPMGNIIAPGYRCVAADGSTATFPSSARFSPDDYHVSGGHSAKGFYSIHINALYDLDRDMYVSALLQSVHQKDEFQAFCDMVDSCPSAPGLQDIFIGDRGYCSYNNMAHVINKGQFFLFRAKDVLSKGLLGNFDLPKDREFDEQVTVTLVRSHSKKIEIPSGSYRRYVDQAASFDYLSYGSDETHTLTFRVVRIELSEGSYECVVTNLPESEFPPERIKTIYGMRWGIESSFRKLKYTIGLSNFHSCKAVHVQQEVWARLLAYNITEAMVQAVVIDQHDTKHTYQANFTMAAHVCRVFLRMPTEEDNRNTMALLQKELIPIRPDRQNPRLQTAHFRKPRHFLYRAA